MGAVTVRPEGPQRLLAAALRDMFAGYARRPILAPTETAIGHSAELRTMAYLLVGAEAVVEGLMDVSMLPPAWRPFHLLWLALLIDGTIAFGAVTRRNPHRLTATALTVRAGLFDQFTVPLADIETVRRERLSVSGRGLRPVPGRADSVICNVTGTAELRLTLRAPLELRLADSSTLRARHLHLAADDPATAHRTLRAASASATPTP